MIVGAQLHGAHGDGKENRKEYGSQGNGCSPLIPPEVPPSNP